MLLQQVMEAGLGVTRKKSTAKPAPKTKKPPAKRP
jgi:hypothetical protein